MLMTTAIATHYGAAALPAPDDRTRRLIDTLARINDAIQTTRDARRLNVLARRFGRVWEELRGEG